MLRFLSAIVFLAAPFALAQETRPNVILVMADDLGYETIGANGGTSYPTPHLDALAKNGARFEHCYVQPLCTPTRVQLMTGLYNVRNYVSFGHLDPNQRTFGNLFQEAGYRTGIAGKWQLGQAVELPRKFGFQEACLWQHTRRPPRYANPGLEYDGVEKDFTNGEYGPDLVNQFALDFISRHKEKPFFLYYPMILTHSPYQATPDSKDWDPALQGEKKGQSAAHFGDMVTYMDKLIGKLVARLEETGLRERTLVIFLGDNGTGKGTLSKMGERTVIGGKGSTTIAGMHVPLIVSWPGTVAPGTVCADLVDSTDFLPTICEAADIPAAETDGRSFLPQLRGQKGSPRDWIYSWYSPRGERAREFAFDSRYKLYRSGELYDLQADPAEQSPLTGEAPAKLKAALEKYHDARPAELAKARKKAGKGTDE